MCGIVTKFGYKRTLNFLIEYQTYFQYTVLEIQFWSIKLTVVTRWRKYFEQLFILIAVCWCKESTSKSFQTCLSYIYLFKLYDRLIIILLKNNLTNNISKTQLLLWMVYTYLQCRTAGEVEKLGRNEHTL